MFGLLTGKIKTYLVAALAVLLPVLYVLGRKDGKNLEKSKVLKDALENEQDKSQFYRSMDKNNHEIENDAPRDRRSLTERLRDNGL
jgi:hypothetical protein